MKILHVVETARGGCGSYLNEILPQQLALLGPAQLRCLAPRQHLDQLDRLPPELLRDFDRPSRARGLPHCSIEIRQDLIADRRGQEAWAARLIRVLDEVRVCANLNYAAPARVRSGVMDDDRQPKGGARSSAGARSIPASSACRRTRL